MWSFVLLPQPGCHSYLMPSIGVLRVNEAANPTLRDTPFFQAALHMAEPAKGSHTKLQEESLYYFMNYDGW